MAHVRNLIVFLGSLIAGGAFVVAAVLKSLDVDGFAHDIALHGVVGPGLSAILARVLIPFELVLGAAAVIGYRRRLALVLLIVTLAGFIGVTGYAWAMGNTEGCGCFGRYVSRGPLAVIVEDMLMIAAAAIALVLSGRGRDRATKTAIDISPSGSPAAAPSSDSASPPPSSASLPPAKPSFPPPSAAPSTARQAIVHVLGLSLDGTERSWRLPLLAVLAVVSMAFTLASPYLPIDSFATALRPGVELRDLGLAQIAGNFAEGDRLLVILVLDQEATRDAIPPLNALVGGPGVPTITGLTSAPEEERAAFFWANAPTFDLAEVPTGDLRRLYRRAPRSFQVHNGRVLRVWNGIPSAKEFVQ